MNQEQRKVGCFSINFNKYALQMYSIIIVLLGLILFLLCLWIFQSQINTFIILNTNTYLVIICTTALAGILTSVGSVLGICAVYREHKKCLITYLLIIVIVFLLQTIYGTLAISYEKVLEIDLNSTLNETFLMNYGIDESQTVAIDYIQQKHKCCGAIRFEDWQKSMWIKSRREERLVPDSCCLTAVSFCGIRDHPSNIGYGGCIYKILEEMRHWLQIIGGTSVGLAMIHLFGMILIGSLYIKLREL